MIRAAYKANESALSERKRLRRRAAVFELLNPAFRDRKVVLAAVVTEALVECQPHSPGALVGLLEAVSEPPHRIGIWVRLVSAYCTGQRSLVLSERGHCKPKFG